MVPSPQSFRIYLRPPICGAECLSKPEMIQKQLQARRDATRSRLLAPRATCPPILLPPRQAKAPCLPKLEQPDLSQAKRGRVNSMFRNTNNGNWYSIDCYTDSRKRWASLVQNPTRTSRCLAYQD